MVQLILEPGSSGIDDNILKSVKVLNQNYPNPAVDFTTIEYTLDRPQRFEFIVQDALGRTIHQEFLEGKAGLNIIRLDLREFEPGVYNYSIITDEKRLSKLMVVMEFVKSSISTNKSISLLCGSNVSVVELETLLLPKEDALN